MINKINCIVLHRIVKDNVTFFEDFELPNFEYLVNIVREKTIITNEIKSINSDSYILTFDDGNKSDFEIVLPILNKFKLFLGQDKRFKALSGRFYAIREFFEPAGVGTRALRSPRFQDLFLLCV